VKKKLIEKGISEIASMDLEKYLIEVMSLYGYNEQILTYSIVNKFF